MRCLVVFYSFSCFSVLFCFALQYCKSRSCYIAQSEKTLEGTCTFPVRFIKTNMVQLRICYICIKEDKNLQTAPQIFYQWSWYMHNFSKKNQQQHQQQTHKNTHTQTTKTKTKQTNTNIFLKQKPPVLWCVSSVHRAIPIINSPRIDESTSP